MEAGRSLLSSPPPFPQKSHIRNCSSSSSSVLMLHEQIAPALASVPTTRINNRLTLRFVKEEHTSMETLDRTHGEAASLAIEEDDTYSSEQYIKYGWPGIWYLVPSLLAKEEVSAYMASKSLPNKAAELINIEPCSVKDLLASREAVSLAADSELFGVEFDESPLSVSTNDGVEEKKIIRSTRLLERRSKRRGVKSKVEAPEIDRFKKIDVPRKVSVEAFDQNKSLQYYLRGPKTKQLLTAEEEYELLLNVQALVKLKEVKARFHKQFAREPTLVEWAEAVGISKRALQSKLRFGHNCREKLINSNLRMVVHLAKKYQGRGLHLEDMLQAGSMGLMKSVDKCKPNGSCRFASYAYWWIRQAIRSTIFQHSRIVRLPENWYALLLKVRKAERWCIQEGNRNPSNEEIASRVGITVKRLERLLLAAQIPVSLQQLVWENSSNTYQIQQVTADNSIETPDLSISKQAMRRHVRSLLKVLSPRERKVIELRFGMEDGQLMTLPDIGESIGLTKERIRQIQNIAFDKLKQNISDHGLNDYQDLLI